MSTVAFLSAEASDQAIARSPMERLARAAGARFEKRFGWNVAVDYGGDRARAHRLLTETVAFADRSQLCKLEVHAAPDALARIVAVLGDGAALEPGRATRTPGIWWCPVTPSRMLVLSEPEAPMGVGAVNEAAGGVKARITIVDMTCGLAALALIGPGCRELLARFCAI